MVACEVMRDQWSFVDVNYDGEPKKALHYPEMCTRCWQFDECVDTIRRALAKKMEEFNSSKKAEDAQLADLSSEPDKGPRPIAATALLGYLEINYGVRHFYVYDDNSIILLDGDLKPCGSVYVER